VEWRYLKGEVVFEQRAIIKKFILVLFLILISFRLRSFENLSKEKKQSSQLSKEIHSKILGFGFKGLVY